MRRQRRRIWWWVAGALALFAVLAVAGPYIYIHFIEGPAPTALSLPKSPEHKPAANATGSASSSASIDGLWKVGTGSIVGYRVQEELLGQASTAVGRTSKAWGSMTISDHSVINGSFTVDMASVKSDQTARNAQFDGRIMDVHTYPTASFRLGEPIELGAVLPPLHTVKRYSATGALTMHGVTRTITFPVSAERSNSAVYALADVPIVFSEWNISNPSIGGFVTTQSHGTLEILLRLTEGAGNAASVAPPSAPAHGGGPITVPKTTVPPLHEPGASG